MSPQTLAAILTAVKILLIVLVVPAVVGFVIVLAERRFMGFMQGRLGPNRVGPQGLLQGLADLLKLMTKEDLTPARAEKVSHFLGPVLSVIPALTALALIPFGASVRIAGVETPLWVADVNVGLLFLLGITSIGVYGIILGGWASNNKFSLLGGLRSAAQLVSYEVSLGLIIIGVIISSGSMNFGDIVRAQDTGWGLLGWYWIPHFPMVFLFTISALAETNRPPFDLPEAESELVAGYQVEYSSTPFLLFMIAEYMAMVLMCTLTAILFFGGWLSPIPGLPDGVLWLVLKILFFFFIYSMVKAITPRYRYDQLMRLGWKVFLPFSLFWVVLVAFLAKYEILGGLWARWTWGV